MIAGKPRSCVPCALHGRASASSDTTPPQRGPRPTARPFSSRASLPYPASVQASFRPPARTTDILVLVVLSVVLSTCLSWLRPSSLSGTICVDIRLKLG